MRKAYKWGAKQYLASMEVGEKRRDDGSFSWRGMQAVACALAAEFNSKWQFTTTQQGRFVTRIR